MGRSVMTVHDATATAYTTLEPDEDYYHERWIDEFYDDAIEDESGEEFESWMRAQWEEDEPHEWEATLEWIKREAHEMWPSLADSDGWLPDHETRVILSNTHSAITVALYSGIVAISLIPNYDRQAYWRDDNALGEHWRKQIAERFEKTFGTMTPLVRFSNGEVGYTTKKKEG